MFLMLNKLLIIVVLMRSNVRFLYCRKKTVYQNPVLGSIFDKIANDQVLQYSIFLQLGYWYMYQCNTQLSLVLLRPFLYTASSRF